MPQFLHRAWSVLHTDRPGEQFIVSDHPVALTWSDGQSTKVGPGHACHNTDLTFPIGSSVALLTRYEPCKPVSEASRDNVAAIDRKTMTNGRHFVAGCSGYFLLQRHGNEVATAAQLVEEIQRGRV